MWRNRFSVCGYNFAHERPKGNKESRIPNVNRSNKNSNRCLCALTARQCYFIHLWYFCYVDTVYFFARARLIIYSLFIFSPRSTNFIKYTVDREKNYIKQSKINQYRLGWIFHFNLPFSIDLSFERCAAKWERVWE